MSAILKGQTATLTRPIKATRLSPACAESGKVGFNETHEGQALAAKETLTVNHLIDQGRFAICTHATFGVLLINTTLLKEVPTAAA